ncbi:hypothetical protein BH20ACT15_BH20ACT15_12710 [soil metagenome]
MSFGAYLAGFAGLATVAISLGLASVRLRARLLPGWSGAPARVVEAVLALSLLTVLLQLLGAIGLFHPAAIVGASIAIAAGAAARFSSPSSGDVGAPPGPPAPAVPKLHLLIALGVVAFLAAHWATGLQDVWGRGMLTFDTLWYHGPFAARIAETGSVWGLHQTDPLYLNWFYPQNSELLHGAGIALFDRDLFSPFINFGWLGLCLVAAWCIGRPYGVAPITLVAVALVLDIGPMVPREAGTPANDVAPVALLLAAAAVLVNAAAQARAASQSARTLHSGGPPLTDLVPVAAIGIAGLAMGLALGTKLTIAGGVAAMAVALPLLLPPGARRKALLFFLGGVAATAGFWFLRNLIHSGTPLPWAQKLGPIDLPGPDRGLEGRDDYNVAHYLFETPDTGVWSSFFYKAITNLFGPLWFVFFGAAATGAVLAIARPRTQMVRLLGIVTVVGGIVYLFTPLTAAGPQDQPLAFGINLRYLVPALALGLALVPLEPKLTPARVRLPLLLGGAAGLALTSLYSDSAYIWDEPFASIPVAAAMGLVFVCVPVGLMLLGRRSALLAAGAGTAAVLAIAAIGWERSDDYFDSRYSNPEDLRFQIDDAVAWARDTSGERIGVAGLSGAYNQYVFYGDELSNHVQYIGRKLSSGDFRAVEDCPAFVDAVAAGDYEYVVTTPELDLNAPATAKASPEGGWLRRVAGADEILREGRVSVFRIDAEPDSADCVTEPSVTPKG